MAWAAKPDVSCSKVAPTAPGPVSYERAWWFASSFCCTTPTRGFRERCRLTADCRHRCCILLFAPEYKHDANCNATFVSQHPHWEPIDVESRLNPAPPIGPRANLSLRVWRGCKQICSSRYGGSRSLGTASAAIGQCLEHRKQEVGTREHGDWTVVGGSRARGGGEHAGHGDWAAVGRSEAGIRRGGKASTATGQRMENRTTRGEGKQRGSY